MPETPPLTHLFAFEQTNDKVRPFIMAEFAANGERNLVLSDSLIREVIKNPRAAKTLRKDLETSGVKFVDAHAPYGVIEDLDLPFEGMRAGMIARHKLALEVVAELGVESITMHVGNTPEEFVPFSLDQLHGFILRSLDELLPVASRLGVVIAIENGWFPTNTPEKLLAILDHFRSPNLGLCFDAGHANLMARDRGAPDSNPVQAWRRFGPVPYDEAVLDKMLPYVTTCHLHDNNGLWDHHLLPGRGEIAWAPLVAKLKTAPRLKCIQNEVNGLYSGASIADSCRVFRGLVETGKL